MTTRCEFSAWLCGTVLVGTVGCVSDSSTVSQEGSLGITDVAVSETRSSVELVARDRSGSRIGSVKVERGRFYMEDHEAVVDGLQLTVDLLGETIQHRSKGVNELQLPLFAPADMAGFNELLLDRRVAPILARWDITFRDPAPIHAAADGPPPSSEEVPLEGCGYSGCNNAETTSCAQTPVWHIDYINWNTCVDAVDEYRCCSNGTANGRACGYPSGQNPCGTPGGGGCATCWSASNRSYCNAWSSGMWYGDDCDDWSGTHTMYVESIGIDHY